MKIAPVADVKARLSTYLKLCAEQPVVVTKNGRPVARIDPIEDVQRLAEARAAGERILARMDARGLVTDEEGQRNWEEIKREMEQEDDQREKRWRSSSTPR